jgi:hypothetical protein
MISIPKGTVSTITRTNKALFNPSSIAHHPKTGDLFVVENTPDCIYKISRIAGSDDWNITPISIARIENEQNFNAVAVYQDNIFLTCWNWGIIIRSSLDGKRTKITGEFPRGDLLAMTVDASKVYLANIHDHVVTTMPWKWQWNPKNHSSFDKEVRRVIRFVVIASRCTLNTSKPHFQLQKLPKEILFHLLSFLDNQNYS